MYIDIFVDIGVPRLGARLPNYEQKWPSFSNVQLFDSALQIYTVELQWKLGHPYKVYTLQVFAINITM